MEDSIQISPAEMPTKSPNYWKGATFFLLIVSCVSIAWSVYLMLQIQSFQKSSALDVPIPTNVPVESQATAAETIRVVVDSLKKDYPQKQFAPLSQDLPWNVSSGEVKDKIFTGFQADLQFDDYDAQIVERATTVLQQRGFQENGLNIIGGDVGGVLRAYEKLPVACRVGNINTYDSQTEKLVSSVFQVMCADL